MIFIMAGSLLMGAAGARMLAGCCVSGASAAGRGADEGAGAGFGNSGLGSASLLMGEVWASWSLGKGREDSGGKGMEAEEGWGAAPSVVSSA
jgi:hypothetical protein